MKNPQQTSKFMPFLKLTAQVAATLATFSSMLALCIYFTPATRYADIGLNVIFAPPVWAALALGGTIGMIGVYKKLTNQTDNSSFFNRHATALSVLGLSLFYGGITQMEMLTSLSALMIVGIHGLFPTIRAASALAIPLLLSSYAVSFFAACFVGLLVPSFVLISVYLTAKDIIFPKPKSPIHPDQKALKKTGKAAGYDASHPFMKKLQQLYQDAPEKGANSDPKVCFNKKEVFGWGLKSLFILAKTPDKARAKKEAALLNEIAVTKMPLKPV